MRKENSKCVNNEDIFFPPSMSGDKLLTTDQNSQIRVYQVKTEGYQGYQGYQEYPGDTRDTLEIPGIFQGY